MRQRKSHIAPLAFLMLVLFVSPMTAKAVHHHVPKQLPATGDPREKSLSQEVNACPFCQFEFVTFIASEATGFTHFSLLSSLGYCESTLDLKVNFFIFYSLRAPPVI
jgi:hypothetical protein